jgi:RimJ/RimL family protein N-acetyltransferase
MRDLTEIGRPPELGDGRLRLRALRPSDKPGVVAALNDPECGRFLWRPPYPYSDADFDEFYATREAAWPERHEALWVVAGLEDDALLAAVSLDIDPSLLSGEFGYYCAPWARRRGVMVSAVRLVRDWAFDEVGLDRLSVMADADNVASQRVAQAAGFQREGLRRAFLPVRGRRSDDVIFGMLPGDPRPAPGERRPGDLGWPRLSDGRLVVRPFEPDDAPAVQAACDDPEVARWIHLLPSPYSLADAEWFVADARRRLAAGERARLAVTDATSGELLGSVSLDRFADRQAAEIGYWVRRDARRRGVALGAARLVIDWAFEELGGERLELLTYPGNEASQALAVRLGFARECLLRGFLEPEPGKSREGRAVPSADGSLPPRDDQVQFARLRSDPAPAPS